MVKRMLWAALLLLLLFGMIPSALAAEPSPWEIYTVEDLQAMAEDPAGSYILMADLDMTGVDWKPIDLNGGSFDGNGHAILNLRITQTGDTTASTYDGNRKEYETSFAGFFGTLRDAEVRNLQLLNVKALVQTDTPCLIGGVAGYAENTTIADCTVTGTLELRAFDRMFGVGGVAGYGSGAIQRCKVDVTLICTDTGEDTLDEQFMGGVYATGYIDVEDCEVSIDGYSSEYGYAHNGGLIGMVMQYPLGEGRRGKLTGNTVSGKITFFEKNANRRAYCEAYVGETLSSAYTRKGNSADFKRDERKDYSAELRPEMCSEPIYIETVVAPGCDSYGYTSYTCEGCGYTYEDNYTLFSHTLTNWTVVEEATTEKEGLSVANCDNCGVEFQRREAKLEPIPTQTTEAVTQPAQMQPQVEVPTEEAPVEEVPRQGEPEILPMAVAVISIVTAAVFLILGREKKRGKYQR